MDILKKLEIIAKDNEVILNNIQKQIDTIEDLLNRLCITSNEISFTKDSITLSLGKRNRKRVIFAYIPMLSNPNKRHLLELPIEERIKAFELVPLLLKEVEKNQISIRNSHEKNNEI